MVFVRVAISERAHRFRCEPGPRFLSHGAGSTRWHTLGGISQFYRGVDRTMGRGTQAGTFSVPWRGGFSHCSRDLPVRAALARRVSESGEASRVHVRGKRVGHIGVDLGSRRPSLVSVHSISLDRYFLDLGYPKGRIVVNCVLDCPLRRDEKL